MKPQSFVEAPPSDVRPSAEGARYAIHGFVLRTPLLAASQFIDLARDLPGTVWGTAEEFAEGVACIRERLRGLVASPEVAEALFIASPALAQSVGAWLAEPLSQRGQKVERSLLKYVARMSTRATPFGLFSGCSAGQLGDRTCLKLEPRSHVQRHSRLDMDYLFALTEALNREHHFRAKLTFRPNDTIVTLGGRYRYIEPRVDGASVRHYHLVAVEATPYLDLVLRQSPNGVTVTALVAALVADDPEVTVEEAHSYVHELIDRHLLVSTFQPPVTGGEPAGVLAADLRTLGEGPIAARLDAIASRLAHLDEAGLGHSIDSYTGMLEILKPLPARVEIARLVQVDLCKPAAIMLGPGVRAEIERCADAFAKFGVISDGLASFRAAFEKRYGTAMVPLLQVLDEESGIGLGNVTPIDESPLIAGLRGGGGSPEESVTWKARHAWMLDRLHMAWSEGRTELVLTDEDMDRLHRPAATAPPTGAFVVGLTVIAPSAEAVDRGDFLLSFRGAAGPSGARILGRFCHADKDIAALVAQHLRAEEANDPDAIFAEIVHLPQGRIGNVILRPQLRHYEIPYLGRSGAPDAQQIPLTDLVVGVRGARTLLWSSKLGRRVVPRLTSAHNFSQAGTLTPYRFLGMLQTEGVRAGFSWDWGALAGVPFLPRVQWNRCVLARATWRATEGELQKLAALSGRERFVAIREWVRARRMPRLVELIDGDNELLVDFDNPLSVDAFVDLVDKRSSVQLCEMLPAPSDLCVAGPEGAYTHQIFVPVTFRQRVVGPPADTTPVGVEGPAASAIVDHRHFGPGSEWMFVKIYAGTSEIDRVLSLVIAPLIAEVVRGGLASRWFFLRYGDPDFHLRVRFRGDPRVLHGEVLPRLSGALAPWLAAGSVNRVQLDTYQPEVERYGGPIGLELSEKVFEIDSAAVLELLGELEGDAGADARWKLALRGLDAMLDDFGLDVVQKHALVARRRREYGAEFNVDATQGRHVLGERFRQHRRTLESLWDRGQDATSDLAPGLSVWAKRSARLRPVADELVAAAARRELSVSPSKLIDSYLHMFVNRLARADGRAYELVLFDFLHRHFESFEARARKGGKRNE
jgi:lantibiotic biosynthesis protein